MELIEVWGYTSMVVVLISMLMKNMKRLRIINSISCAMFIIYGAILGAYPIVLLNTLVIVINVFRLIKGE
jgi:hypothetical protein